MLDVYFLNGGRLQGTNIIQGTHLNDHNRWLGALLGMWQTVNRAPAIAAKRY